MSTWQGTCVRVVKYSSGSSFVFVVSDKKKVYLVDCVVCSRQAILYTWLLWRLVQGEQLDCSRASLYMMF